MIPLPNRGPLRAPSTGRARTVTGIAAAALLLLPAGCSSGEPTPQESATTSGGDASASASASSESAPAPTGFDLPEGVTLTDPGSELSLGESATVAVEPNRTRGSALTLQVDEIRKGRTSDLDRFVLTDRAKKATPYYVDVAVTNDGPGDLGGYAVPLYGQFDDTALIENTTFATPFDTCPSTPLPNRFGPDATADRCLVFLVPDGKTLQGVAFARAGSDPIAWSGTITPPEQDGKGSDDDGGSGGGSGSGNG